MGKTIVGLYDSYEDAREVQQDLVSSGINASDISILAANSDERYSDFVDRAIGEDEYDDYRSGEWYERSQVETTDVDGDAEHTREGAVAGGIIGGVGAALLAILVPGLGPFVGAGWLVAGLVGLAGGAVVGGLMGAMVDAGIDEEDATVYSEGVRRGYVLVSVRADDDEAQQVADVMNRHGAIDTDQRADYWRSEGWDDSYDVDAPVYSNEEIKRERTSYNNYLSSLEEGGEASIPVVEEELRVGKRAVQTGGARVLTRVTEEPVEEEVTLRRERINVERERVDRPVDSADIDAFEEGVVELTAQSEEVVVDKQARVVEEVRVSKEVEEVTETVRDTVRRTDVEVEEDVDRVRAVDTDTDVDWDNNYRTHYQSTYASTGRDYDYYEPHYRYGQELSGRYADRDWNDIEGDVRTDWERRNAGGDTVWDDVKDAVQSAWTSAKRAV